MEVMPLKTHHNEIQQNKNCTKVQIQYMINIKLRKILRFNTTSDKLL